MFAQRLKQLRAENKMTQVQLAEKLGVSKGTVAMWETDKRNLHIFATPEGEALEGVILETARDFFNLITEGMSPEEKSSLDALCQKICANAKEAIRKK